MPSELVNINSEILEWARVTAGLSIEEAVKKFARKTVKVETIHAWESGSEAPTYNQLERLAYEVYKRPLAIFFFPAPPKELTPKQSFRTLPDIEIAKFAHRMHILIRNGRVMQLNLSELNDKVNPSESHILKSLKFAPNNSVEEIVESVRKFLGITLAKQRSWNGTEEAFKQWRTALENAGIGIFKDAFRVNEFSGFCLYDAEFPVVYVNNSKPHSRQIFTLFHELAHLLFQTGGVDKRLDSYIRRLTGDDRKIEVNCNKFAAQFLIPNDDFKIQTTGARISESFIETLATRYNVSREVVLRLFLDRKSITQEYYDQLTTKWLKQITKKKGTGGDYYRTQGAYLGKRYLELAFSRYQQGRISVDQLADYLNVKPDSVAGMESILVG